MRTKQRNICISVSESVYNRLKEDREQFGKDIGGGRWSFSDTINEYVKTLDSFSK